MVGSPSFSTYLVGNGTKNGGQRMHIGAGLFDPKSARADRGKENCVRHFGCQDASNWAVRSMCGLADVVSEHHNFLSTLFEPPQEP